MKKIAVLLSIGFLAVILIACGSSDEGEQASSDEGADSDSSDQTLLEQIQESGELVIGTEGTYRPYTFHDENDELTGFDVEIAREVAERLGVKPVFNETKWDSMFAGLNAKRFDMVANQVGINEDRQKKYAFSDPYIQSSAVIVTHEDNDSIQDFSDLEGVTTAQSMTSNYADIARENGAEINSVEGFNESMQLLSTKRVEATVNDRLSVLDYLNQRDDVPVKIAVRQDEASKSGLLFRQGNDELVKAVNEALQEMKDDGTYSEISEKWFGEDVSK
ncbi:amino acid ABC transporter substrate-binding protein [Halobacillus karajensis]|uniref:L-cystine-binding protein TcyA n=1 Tax=Halobacillus karajensis TaxID=195088 RepID=A0A024P588_9BACI|nr:amino acid ABC transporter substrate-binding protein [Halobacillus karajensis]CDQ20578.1 L-cystine-binding protein TcyA precursor [Halobacillus karajensis]CDQ23953.1 L-cystine-binding protein TcyA precursor [Halobacillus karajensis]CDQ27431.1 L-cystine-binding protein TcyA precursor [Halobacillus karajensis]